MRFDDMLGWESTFTYKDALEYVSYYWDDLEAIYDSDQPFNGAKGTVWRIFYGEPQKINPLMLYLNLKVIDLEGNLSDSNKKVKKVIRERNRSDKKVCNNESQIDALTSKNDNLTTSLDYEKGRLDNEDAKALLDSIMALVGLCKKNEIPIDISKLPHHNILSPKQIEYLKSLK